MAIVWEMQGLIDLQIASMTPLPSLPPLSQPQAVNIYSLDGKEIVAVKFNPMPDLTTEPASRLHTLSAYSHHLTFGLWLVKLQHKEQPDYGYSAWPKLVAWCQCI